MPNVHFVGPVSKNVRVVGYMNGTTGFRKMCFVFKMQEPLLHVSIWTLNMNGGTRTTHTFLVFSRLYNIMVS